MRIGLIARADATGLGVQTHEFYTNMKPAKTMVVDLTRCSGRPMDLSLYPDCSVLDFVPYPDTNSLDREASKQTQEQIDAFLEGLDLIFTCETPYDYYLFTQARRMGVKTVLQYNFELLDYQMDRSLPRPDLLAAPSRWRINDVRERDKIFLPVPVNTDRFPRREYASSTIKTWFHPGGNPVMEDRNGTRSAINAFRMLQGHDVELIVRSPDKTVKSTSRNVSVVRGMVQDNAELYPTEAEGLVFPRKFGGLCLPLNEAMALGMPTVMTNLEPQNEFLVREGLCTAHLAKEVFTKDTIQVYEPDLEHLADIIKRLSWDEDLVGRMRQRSREITDKISWTALKPVYEETFADLLEGKQPIEQKFEWGTFSD